MRVVEARMTETGSVKALNELKNFFMDVDYLMLITSCISFGKTVNRES